MFFDSHAHLEDEKFDPDRENVIASLPQNGVDNVINVGSDLRTSEKSVEFAEKYGYVYAAAGFHPSAADSCKAEDFDKLRQLLRHPKCVALGEIGLDYSYDTPSKGAQRRLFEEQCKIAKDLDMPVAIHDRDAHEECFDMVKKYGLRGVFHCFSGAKEMALRLVDIGFYISFTGVLTFRNAKKAVQAAAAVPLERILIETDCPYMAPEPHRGTRNEPKFVCHVAEKLAEIKGIPIEQAARATAQNTKRLFGKVL